MNINGIDHIELYSGNARQSAHFYRTVMGFQPVAYSGPETGRRDSVSYLLKQGDATLLLSSGLCANGCIGQHVQCHGDGVRDIALNVDDVKEAFEEAIGRGASPVAKPHKVGGEDGDVMLASVATFGDTIHTFIDRRNYRGVFLPGFRPLKMRESAPAQLDHIDHLAVAVPPGAVAEYAAFYENVFGFKLFFEEETVTEYSSMKSKVVQNSNKSVTFVFVEPSSGKRKSPIEEYLTYYQGPGVHHIALSCKDIIRSVGALKDAGLDFTFTPGTYYEMLPQRIGSIAEDIERLSSLGILADRDHNGYLLQIFSQPLQDRPTFFFEIIQRAGAQGFGSGNIKALFEAIERAQVARGNA